MSRARDSQRAKFWKAWRGVDWNTDPMTLDECEQFIADVLTSRWWRSHGYNQRVAVVTVKDGRARTNAGVWRTNPARVIMTLPTATRTQQTILRQLAYMVVPADVAWHGRETCRLLLDMIARFLPSSDESRPAGELRAQFITHKVKFRRPAEFSPEAKARLKERGEALHDQRTERYVEKLESDYRV